MDLRLHPDAYRFGAAEVRPAERTLLIGGAPARLGARAFDVLLTLVERRDRVVGKEELFDAVWPGLVVEENNLQVQVSSLRRLLGPEVIATVAGRGYQFTAPVEHVAVARRPGAAGPAAAAAGNLPQPRTRFIGREQALADGVRLLTDARLLTLAGIGGCGKTRLALQLALLQAPQYADGVWFIDLAPLQDGQRLAAAVAATLGVAEEAGTALPVRLATQLASRRMLVLLDNCEHVLDAAAELVDALLAACSGLKVLATSREALGVSGEQVLHVRSLSLPQAADFESVGGSEAVRVFVDRARLTLPEFALDARNAPAVAEICRRLDGIALAIELAAARVQMLSVEAICARLDDRFRLLSGGRRAVPRHQTLRATMQWSFDLLTPAEQRLFARLAVFAGGWTLAAATQVAGDEHDEYAVLGLLSALQDKSLLLACRDDAPEPRYQMLETVRQYAQERLGDSGAGDEVRDRHLAYYCALAEEAERRLLDLGSAHGSWMRRLGLDQENLLAAHAWCRQHPRGVEPGLRLNAALWRYWLNSAQIECGSRMAREALERAGDGPDTALRCRALWALGNHEFFRGGYERTLALAQQCLEMARRIGDPLLVVRAVGLLGAGCHASGRHGEALAHYTQACETARALGQSYWLGTLLNGIAEVHRSDGNLAAAEPRYREAIAIARSAGGPVSCSIVGNLACVMVATGRLDQARALLLEGVAGVRESGMLSTTHCLLGAATGLASVLGDHAQAARFHGAAQARLAAAGSRIEPVDAAFAAPRVERSRQALGASAFDAAVAGGRTLGFEASIGELEDWLQVDRAPLQAAAN